MVLAWGEPRQLTKNRGKGFGYLPVDTKEKVNKLTKFDRSVINYLEGKPLGCCCWGKVV